MTNTRNIEQAKKLIKESKKPIIVKAQNDEFNRKILEYGKFDILLSIESGNRRDKPKQLDSGFNETLADIAHKNKVSIGVDIQNLTNLKKEEKAKTLARIKQNIKISRKRKVNVKLINFKNKVSARALLVSLGSSTKQASESLTETISF